MEARPTTALTRKDVTASPAKHADGHRNSRRYNIVRKDTGEHIGHIWLAYRYTYFTEWDARDADGSRIVLVAGRDAAIEAVIRHANSDRAAR